MIALYNCLLLLAALFTSPYWLVRLCLSRKHRNALGLRLGAVPARLTAAAPPTLWLHAVSVGEVMAAAPLVALLKQEFGESHRILVSTTTATGNAVARNLFGADAVFYCPLDFSWAVQRYVAAIRPHMLILMESELWPNLITRAHRAGAQVVVVNARISDRSYPRYTRLRWFWRNILANVSLFLTSSELDARRLRAMGVPASRLRVNGNLKFDLTPPPEPEFVARLRANLPPDAPVLVCGSTLDPEERELLHSARRIRAFLPNLVTIIAPRHPDRFDAVNRLLPAGSLRRSTWAESPAPLLPGSVLLLDSVGELAAVYAIGTVAFVGGSLVPAGGHNPLEPAMAGLPVVMGISVENFRSVAGVLEGAGALMIVTPDELTDRLMSLLRDRKLSAELGRRGRAALLANRGATQRAAHAILELLHSSA